MSDGSSRDDAALIMFFRKSSDDIEFAKRGQWRAAYYALLAYGALVGVASLDIHSPRPISLLLQTVIPIAAALIVAIFAWRVFDDCHCSMVKARKRMDLCAHRVSDRRLKACWTDKDPEFTSPTHQLWYLRSLKGITVGGAVGSALLVVLLHWNTLSQFLCAR